jgi:hypothetical protein
MPYRGAKKFCPSSRLLFAQQCGQKQLRLDLYNRLKKRKVIRREFAYLSFLKHKITIEIIYKMLIINYLTYFLVLLNNYSNIRS